MLLNVKKKTMMRYVKQPYSIFDTLFLFIYKHIKNKTHCNITRVANNNNVMSLSLSYPIVTRL